MVARPRIVGMEIIHNCCVLQPVRRLHQQRSAIGTRVLVAEVMSGTKIFHHAIPLDQIGGKPKGDTRSEENTSEHQSPMRISYAVLCLTKKKQENKVSEQ